MRRTHMTEKERERHLQVYLFPNFKQTVDTVTTKQQQRIQ